MMRWFLGLVLAIGFMLIAPAVDVRADSDSGSDSAGGFSAPELDPAAAGSAAVLLLGGVAYLASRRRKDDAA